jgi:hypothetical protein
MLWDHLFGTYQMELDDVPPIYGITVPVRTWNPFKIDYMHWWCMLKDTWHAEKWIDKFNVWIRSTGWRPDGHAEKYPLGKVEDVSQFGKYSTDISYTLKLWSFLEVSLVAYPLTMLFFWMLGQGISSEEKLLYTAFSLFSIFTYTTSMEGKPTRLLNMLRLFFSLGIIILSVNNTFTFNLFTYQLTPLLISFYFAATILSFIRIEKSQAT